MAHTFSSHIDAREGTFYHAKSDRWYRVFRKDGAWYMRRWQAGDTNVIEKRIDYAVGSGTHARSFLHRAEDGRLFELPVTWYGSWNMSPGFDRPDHQDFRREVSDTCLFCHNAYPADAGMGEGIDCQRCHGPGAAHVRQPSRKTIVNPARLSPERKAEVCWQCHLQTTSQPLPDALRRFGRTAFSYRPGEPLADYRLYFDDTRDKFEVNSAAYRLRQSRCNVTCTDCHDAHHQKQNDVRQVCRGCHASIHEAARSDCVGCHMPKRRAQDAVHVVLTDHKIQRRPEPERAASPTAYRGPVRPYYPESMDPLWLALAQVRDGSNLEEGIRELEKLTPQQPEFVYELGEAYRRAGRFREAAACYRKAGAVGRMGEALLRAGDVQDAIAALERAPRDAEVLNSLGVAYGQAGKLDESIQALMRATHLRPEMPLAWLNLGVSLEQHGEYDRAEAAYRRALREQPDFTRARQHLDRLLAARKGDR